MIELHNKFQQEICLGIWLYIIKFVLQSFCNKDFI